ncbi:hypothetical protein ACLOJK_037497, partial [Asimina triloba]
RNTMEKLCKFHITKIILTALLLLITPFLSSSMRPPYLYLIVNLLILALGAESGLLTALGRSNAAVDDKKLTVIAQPATTDQVSASDKKGADDQEKDGAAAVKVHKVIVKKCPSTPSLFFIGGSTCDVEEKGIDEDEDDEMVDAISGAELFTKAEIFIGNFYKQLKMQREDSWKKIHGLFT